MEKIAKALTRINNAFKESEFNCVYIVGDKIVIELKSGRNFELSTSEVEHQAFEHDKENQDIENDRLITRM